MYGIGQPRQRWGRPLTSNESAVAPGPLAVVVFGAGLFSVLDIVDNLLGLQPGFDGEDSDRFPKGRDGKGMGGSGHKIDPNCGILRLFDPTC